jgi:methyltransferase (TIGR00027 family)
MSESDNPIRNVSDTALWVAMYRAYESERPDAHFRDPYARRLAGARGPEIVRSIPGGRAVSWAMVVRTTVMDEIILRLIRDEGVDTVLNLAAGLDARPWRLELSTTLRWVDVDLPDMLAYKQRELAGETPRCRYEGRAVDLRDASARLALFAEVGAHSRRTLILSEGLLVYLEPDAVAALARDLARRPAFRWWLIDIISPQLAARMKKGWKQRLEQGNAPFRFVPEEGTRFFAPFGWREREFRSTWDEAARLKREMSLAWLWRFIARFASLERRAVFRRLSGIALMERA